MREAARGRMKHRMDTERNTTATTSAWKTPDAPTWTAQLTAEPCWAWTRAKKEALDKDKAAVVEDFRAMVSIGTDVTDDDRIANIKDRAGTVIFAGPIRIEAIQRYPSHLELILEAVN